MGGGKEEERGSEGGGEGVEEAETGEGTESWGWGGDEAARGRRKCGRAAAAGARAGGGIRGDGGGQGSVGL